MTVEDPIEFLHHHKTCLVNQREVGEDTQSFPNALKHVLRQDPDIILVGEMRDLETISVALTAAETGHLVFATLHTQDAAQTIDRVIDVFPPHQQQQVRVQLAGALQGVVCQTLCKTRRRPRPGRSPPRCWSPPRRSATSSARARPTRSTPRCRPARSTACTPWTSTSPTWCGWAGSPTSTASRSATTSRTSTASPAGPERQRTMATATKTYEYSVRDRTGKLVKGKLEAETEAAVVQQAQGHGLRAGQHHARPSAGMKQGDQAPGRQQGQAQGPRGHVAGSSRP